jgi:hypothetical protein
VSKIAPRLQTRNFRNSLGAWFSEFAYHGEMKIFTVVGFWKFKSNRVRREDGEWLIDQLMGGTMAFSENGQAVLFVRTEQGPWGYSGAYRIEEDKMMIQVETSSADGLDGTMLDRRIEVINSDEFKFTGLESHTGRQFETIFVRA